MSHSITKKIGVILFSITLIISGCQSSKEDKTAEDSEESTVIVESGQNDLYELRTYYAANGKLENLLDRFQDHTLTLFHKHGMENVAYWVPIENSNNLLIYLLRFSDEAGREASWNAFREDPDWISAKEASEVDGSLVDSVKSQLLRLTDFSPAVEMIDMGPRVFELRTYYCNEGKLENLHTRFREHTMEIFSNHGMTNVAYFDFTEDKDGKDNTLIYFLSHQNEEAAKENWQGFLDDPEWQSVYAASIENGKLVDHLSSVFLRTTNFSPLK